MANKTFHIPSRDEGLWDAAQRIAAREQISLYRLVADALEAHITAIATRPAPAERWAHIAADAA